MEEKLTIIQELVSIAPVLTQVSRKMPFAVPEGYFELVALDILALTHKNETRASVPEGYFDALPGAILSRVRAIQQENDTGETGPILSNVNRTMPYSLPEGYFETFRVEVKKHKAPVIPIKTSYNSFNRAAAAVVIFLAGLFVWERLGNLHSVSNTGVFTTTNLSADSTIASALANIEDTSINLELSNNGIEKEINTGYYYLHTDNIETALHDLSDEEINTQLASLPSVKNKS